MAKEKKEKISISVEELINKKYGDGICETADVIQHNKPQILKVSPAINCLLNGGIPEGSWVNIAGKKKIGKTTLTLTIARAAINAGKKVYYMNVEGRLKDMNLSGIHGLDASKMKIIKSTDEKILSAQDYLNIGETILLNERGVVLIIDSLAALAHDKEFAEGVGTSTMGGTQKLVSQFCAQMSNVVPVRGHIVVSIQRMMANLGYGAKFVIKGGNDIGYQGDIILIEKGREDWNSGERIIGHKVNWECECSALGTLPGSNIKSAIRYGYGIDDIEEIIGLAIDYALIDQRGAWYYLDFLENNLDIINEKEWSEDLRTKWKSQGADNLGDLLRTNPKITERLEQIIYKTVLGK